ncbi:ImmA/IrrE family metallo-endopeptidase [Natroniella acetigena]|uniref:ImmA/IrrE family metallo-endopeptidase n=1 Tax=Natroniella acetigena TaxID=52004 RepID=UPI00200AF3C0|nr:ImmA/IrrE family metallo-endopeptidase [Natroniella acetigena]MCK8826362.1 ImmA/IrrE family metallo-endopeptidase [Natroniella acetigena]
MAVLSKLREHDIQVNFMSFHPAVRGFVYPCPSDHYHVIINERISFEMRRKTLIHEVAHILKHLPNKRYLVNIDNKRIYFEKEADEISRKVLATLKK